MNQSAILVADDQVHVVEALRLLLKSEGYAIETADSPRAVLASMQQRSYDVLLMDLNYARDTTSGQEGLDLIGEIRRLDGVTPIVVMTAWSTVSLAVEAMQRGAHDFVSKPWDNTRLLTIVRTQAELGRASRRTAELEARLQQDLRLAGDVQRQLLPARCPELLTLDCSARWTPAGVVGGDYFDFIRIDADRLALAVGDVAGKGVAAALVMASLQAHLRTRAATYAGAVDRVAAETSQRLFEALPANKYATLFYGLYDERLRTLTYVNAGHNPPLLLRVTGAVERLGVGGPVLGLFADAVFTSATVTLGPGDVLVVYTDGITESRNDEDEEFGDGRLIAAAESCRDGDAAAVRDGLLAAHAAFTAGNAPVDDMTLLVARCR